MAEQIDGGFCTSCGVRLDPKARSCARCGAPVTDLGVESGPPLRDSSPAAGATVSRAHLARPEPAAPASPAASAATQTARQPQASVPAGYGAQPSQGFAVPPPGYAVPQPGSVTADLGTRVLARLLDGALVMVPITVVYVANITFVSQGDSAASLVASLVLLLMSVALITYDALSVGRLGQTIGRRTLGIQIVDVRTGGAIGPGRGLARNVIFALMALPCYAGYLSYFFDSTGQHLAWHDKVAGDRVVVVGKVPFGQAVKDVLAVIRF